MKALTLSPLLLIVPALVACSDDDLAANNTDGMSEMDMPNAPDAPDGTDNPATPENPTGEMPDPAPGEALENSIASIAAADGRFGTLVGALQATGLDAPLSEAGEYTVFAPTDAAFELLPEGLVGSLSEEVLAEVLKYHVVSGAVVEAATAVTLDEAETLQGGKLKLGVSGETLYLNGLTAVTVTDIKAANGIIHVIDSVLIPGEFPGSIVDVVTSYPRLSTLAGAATAEVVEALQGEDLTLLAPINDAFEGVDVPEEPAALENILLYHALPVDANAETVMTLASAQAANGAFMGIKTADGVQIDDGSGLTKVIYTDIDTQNGTIHLIDEVLIPPPTIAEVAVAAGLSSLVDALGAANVPGTETTFAEAAGGSDPLTVFAPSNEAFAKIPAAGFGADLANVLGAHVISGAVDSKAVLAAMNEDSSPETITGAMDNKLQLVPVGDSLLINGKVGLVATDVPAANGLVHLVDAVILPADIAFPGNLVEAVSAYPAFSSLVEAVTNADPAVATALTGAGPLTLFAPFNSAFEGVDTSADLADVLLYHAYAGEADSAFVVANLAEGGDITMANEKPANINGTDLTINDANIERVDLRASNGIIHVIDKVLSPMP